MKLFNLKQLVAIASMLLPWSVRKRVLCKVLGYELASSSRIGFSVIFCLHLRMGENSRIGHLNVVKGLSSLSLGESAVIGNLNWITGFPVGTASVHFLHLQGRTPSLSVGNHSAITHRHLIDCTSPVKIGSYSTLAGFRSQVLTHSIDLQKGRQDSRPVEIGSYCFIGTGCILLGGAGLPDYSVLGAGSLLNGRFSDTYHLYAGSPARSVKELPRGSAYFTRAAGFVN